MSQPAQLSHLNDLCMSQGYEMGPRCCATKVIQFITGIALFIIGCMGAAGAFPGSIGWAAVGLAAGGFVLNLSLGKFKIRKYDLIADALLTTVILTISALGITGIFSTAQVGWGILGTSLAALPVSAIFGALKKKQTQEYVQRLQNEN